MAENTIAPEKEEEVELLYDQYTFSCSCNGTESGESDLLKVNPPGVSIHFMRYGLAKKDFTDVFLYPKDKEPTPQAIDDAPFFTYYKYVRTSLREGWIFIYNECTGKMTRYETDAPVGPYILQKDDTIWAAYSDVNWCQEYYDAMCSDADKRAKRMQKISWDDWYNKKQLEHGTCVEKVDGAFYTNYEAYNFGRQHESALANEEDPGKKENLFFCLHDPMGIAYQLAYELQHQWNLMDALLISIKLGVERDKVLKCLQEGGDPACLQTPDQEPEQITALFNIASTLRGVAFTSDESREKMGQHLDAGRLAAVLATEERHRQKQQIQEARNHLKQYLEQPYYLDILADYKENGDEEIQNCWFFTAKDFLSLLAPMPNSKDGFMDTPEESKKWNAATDTCHKFIFDVLSRNNELGNLYNEQTIIDIAADPSNYVKLVGVFDNLMNVAVALPTYADRILGKMEKVFNNITIETVDGTLDGLVEMESLSLSLLRHQKLTDEVKRMLNITPASLAVLMNKNLTYLIKYEQWLEVKQLTFTKNFEDTILRNEKLKVIKGFQSSMLWARFLKNVSGLNLMVAGFAMGKTENTFEGWLSFFKLGAAFGDLHVAQRGVKEAIMTAKNIDNEYLKVFRNVTKSQALKIGYAGAIIDGAEAAYNFWERDYDAAAAYTGAAIFGGIAAYAMGAALAASIAGSVAVVNFWNPVGWGAAIAAIGLGILAVFMEDDHYERYAKNCIFRDLNNKWYRYLAPVNPIIASGVIGMELLDLTNSSKKRFSGDYINQIKQHVERRDFLGDRKGWNDYQKGFKALLDLLFGGRVILHRDAVDQNPAISTSGGNYSMSIDYTYKVLSMRAEIIYPRGITDICDLDYKIYYCPKGTGKGGYLPLEIAEDTIQAKIVCENEQPPRVEISFDISEACKEDIHRNAEIVFMSRLKTKQDYYLPTEQNGETRYVASKLDIFVTDKSSVHLNKIKKEEHKALKMDTKQNLLDGNESWWEFE